MRPASMRLLADKAARKIKAPLDVQMRSRFDVLRQNFAQQRLLREILRADHDRVARPSARSRTRSRRHEKESRAPRAISSRASSPGPQPPFEHAQQKIRAQREQRPPGWLPPESTNCSPSPAREKCIRRVRRRRPPRQSSRCRWSARSRRARPREPSKATAAAPPDKESARSVMPMPRAASRTAGSTPAIPAAVLRMIGSSA